MIVDHQKSVESYKVLLSLLTELFKISVPVGYMQKSKVYFASSISEERRSVLVQLQLEGRLQTQGMLPRPTL